MFPAMNDVILKHLIDPRTSKILLDLVKSSRVTVKGLCERNPDIPRSTMYRLLTRMERDGIIEVVEYQQKRGTVEKTYALRSGVLPGPEDSKEAITHDQLSDLFLVYCIEFANQFRTYAETHPGNVTGAEMMGFWTAPVYATDREMRRLIENFMQSVSEHSKNSAEGGRKLHSVGFIVAPSVERPETRD